MIIIFEGFGFGSVARSGGKEARSYISGPIRENDPTTFTGKVLSTVAAADNSNACRRHVPKRAARGNAFSAALCVLFVLSHVNFFK